MAKGCLQHSILSSLLWSLVVDQFIEGLNENSCYIVGYTDDMVTLICRKFCNITELLQVALSMVQKWCDRTKLSINSQKMAVTQFTRSRCLRGLGSQPSLDTHILDRGLTWKAQLKMWWIWPTGLIRTCMGTFGRTWRSETQHGAWHFHHGNQSHSYLQLHGLVA